MSSLSFKKKFRLLNAFDYKDVFEHNQFRAAHKNILILAKKNTHPQGRLGVIVAKKNTKRAVDRNRIKRIIREQFRLQKNTLSGIDLVVLSRPGLVNFNNAQLSDLLNKQFLKIQKQCL